MYIAVVLPNEATHSQCTYSHIYFILLLGCRVSKLLQVYVCVFLGDWFVVFLFK